jgi:HTH-type transcriptional regulator / antitoxin HigA
MNIKPIRTREDHARALKDLERLWDRAGKNTPEGEAFEVLSTLVDAYEREHFPIPCPDPIAAIQFRMEQGEITKGDLVAVLGTSGRTSEILNRRRRLSLLMIRRLHERYQIPLECLVATYALKKRTKTRAASVGTTRKRSAAAG